MINWVIIGLIVFLFIVISLVIRFKYFKHHLTIVVFFVLIVLLLVSFVTIAKQNSFSIKEPSTYWKVTKVYFSWVGHAFGNLKTLTTNAIKMDWFPQGTNITEIMRG